jgi:hypothetical protein
MIPVTANTPTMLSELYMAILHASMSVHTFNHSRMQTLIGDRDMALLAQAYRYDFALRGIMNVARARDQNVIQSRLCDFSQPHIEGYVQEYLLWQCGDGGGQSLVSNAVFSMISEITNAMMIVGYVRF